MARPRGVRTPRGVISKSRMMERVNEMRWAWREEEEKKKACVKEETN